MKTMLEYTWCQGFCDCDNFTNEDDDICYECKLRNEVIALGSLSGTYYRAFMAGV